MKELSTLTVDMEIMVLLDAHYSFGEIISRGTK